MEAANVLSDNCETTPNNIATTTTSQPSTLPFSNNDTKPLLPNEEANSASGIAIANTMVTEVPSNSEAIPSPALSPSDQCDSSIPLANTEAIVDSMLLGEEQRMQQIESQLHKRHSVSAGATSAVVRSMILKPLYLWYKSPLKLFRPVRVDYLVMARAIAPPASIAQEVSSKSSNTKTMGALLTRWRASTIGLLANAVRQEGWSFIPRHVLPPLMANGACGAVLFTTYELVQMLEEEKAEEKKLLEEQRDRLMKQTSTESFLLDQYSGLSSSSLSSTATATELNIPVYSYLKAGAIAGAMHAVVATPLDALQVRLEVQDFLSGRFRGFMEFARATIQELGPNGMYRGFLFTLAKDSLGYAIFFSVFDSAKVFLHHRKAKGVSTTSLDETLMNTASILTAGAAAGAAYQLIDHPLDRVRSTLLLKGGEQVHGGLYATSWHRCRRLARMAGGWRPWLYAGLATNLMKAVPATSIGLFCYEMLKQTYEDDDEDEDDD